MNAKKAIIGMLCILGILLATWLGLSCFFIVTKLIVGTTEPIRLGIYHGGLATLLIGHLPVAAFLETP